MLAPPPGDAYNFLLNLISYPLAIVNAFVSAGLIYLYLNEKRLKWNPPFRATLPVAVLFLLSNIYLVIAPYIPPDGDDNIYNDLPYYLHCVVALGIFALGAIYWLVWTIILPKIGNYRLVVKTTLGEDGWSRNQFVKEKL
ncbi:hypothetical protein QCA50_007482 [Cerrena zonata]|uniref:Uncharacterized protein n=1 Tax=Cerrena zonata TaxID=2478898 RepID=A0AAW0GDS1_9APHY